MSESTPPHNEQTPQHDQSKPLDDSEDGIVCSPILPVPEFRQHITYYYSPSLNRISDAVAAHLAFSQRMELPIRKRSKKPSQRKIHEFLKPIKPEDSHNTILEDDDEEKGNNPPTQTIDISFKQLNEEELIKEFIAQENKEAIVEISKQIENWIEENPDE